MTPEQLNFHYQDGSDIGQPGDIVIILAATLGIFLLVQLINGVTNIMTARHMRKIQIAQNEKRELEMALQLEQVDSMIEKFTVILDHLNSAEDMNQQRFEEIMEYLDNIPLPPKGIKKRGPYKPRKPKALEHKKTPPEN